MSREFASRKKTGRVRVNEQGHSGREPEDRMGRDRQWNQGTPQQRVSEGERRGPRLRWSTITAGRLKWSHSRTSCHRAELSSSETSWSIQAYSSRHTSRVGVRKGIGSQPRKVEGWLGGILRGVGEVLRSTPHALSERAPRKMIERHEPSFPDLSN